MIRNALRRKKVKIGLFLETKVAKEENRLIRVIEPSNHIEKSSSHVGFYTKRGQSSQF